MYLQVLGRLPPMQTQQSFGSSMILAYSQWGGNAKAQQSHACQKSVIDE